MSTLMFWTLFALITKHFVLDFPCQGPYQYLNKGTYLHPGGLLHSGIQGVGTFLALCVLYKDMLSVVFWLSVVDFFVHYHIDYVKMNLNRIWGLHPMKNEEFWWMLGLDQYLHYLTYFGFLYYLNGAS